MPLTIAFDADDTLWHNERYYEESEARFTEVMVAYGIQPADTLAALHRIDVINLPSLGYGIKGFMLSMIETAIELTEGQIRGNDVKAILEIGKSMLTHPIELLEGAREAVEQLSINHPLMLITKGDLLDQERKIRESGLAQFFRQVEVVSEKSPAIYAGLLDRHGLTPGEFLMVGNSPRSDVLPVLQLGGYAVYVPYATTWVHEQVQELPPLDGRFHQIQTLSELTTIIRHLNK